MSFVRLLSRTGMVALLAFAMLLPFASVSAQDLPVLVLPVDQAQFLPGAVFDFRVEVHAEALPEDFAVTVNGTDASAVFGTEPTAESWAFGPEDAPTPAQSWVWRSVTAPAPGEYVVEVTAADATTSVTWVVREPSSERVARNIILFVADGMSVPTITAARAARGITQGRPINRLAMDSAEFIGLASTSSVDSIMADSANTASALNTGHIGSVNATGSYSDTSPDSLDDPRVETLGSLVSRLYGMSVGVVTTADFSDATPAAVWAHGRNRGNGNRNAYLVQALESGYVDVLMGGGARRLIPQTVEGSRREDDRDLYAEYEAAGYTIVTSATEMNAALAAGGADQMLGVFHPNDMNVWLDRNVYTDNLGEFTDQPGLTDMTLAAIQVLSQNENGFYLQVEAASVDKQLHPLDQERALSDLIEFDQAIAAAAAWAAENAPDTLIIATADHGHGYDVYGTVNLDEFTAATDDAGRREAIDVYNGARYPNYPDVDGDGFPEWQDASRVFAGTVNNGPDHTEDFQVSPVPRVPAIDDGNGVYVDNPEDDPNGIPVSGVLDIGSSTGVHTLQDVPVFAWGPGAQSVVGLYHQSEIFFIMASALGLNPAAGS
ncbi:MAG: alkaline phosphatase [Anaerolineae bacterium]|nr:alkaline phosphatase [Anaerolineae bacterium]